MENYSLELYNAAKTTRQAFLSNYIIEAECTEELGGNFYLDLLLNPYVFIESGSFELVDWYSQLAEKKTVKVIRKSDGSSEFFIIQKITKEKIGSKDLKKGFMVRLYCEHYKFRLLELITQLFGKEYAAINATTALNLIKDNTGSGSEFTIGTINIPTDEYKDLKFDPDNAYNLIALIAKSWDYMDADEEKNYTVKINSSLQIDLLTEANYGSDVDQPIKFAKNARGIVKLSDASTLANRIFPVGKEGTDMRSAGLTYKEDATGSEWKYTGELQGWYMNEGSKMICPETYIFLKMKIGYAVSVVSSPVTMDYKFRLELYDSDGILVSNEIKTETRTPSTNPSTEIIFLNVFDLTDVNILKMVMESATKWDKGTVTSGTSTTLSDSTKNWTINQWAGIQVKDKTTGETKTVASNTATQLTISGTWTNIPLATEEYFINAEDPAIATIERCWFVADNKLYVEDPTSQSSYGVIEQSIKDNDVDHCINVIKNSIFTDGQTSWSATGGATVTVNTDPDYIYHGIKSLKVVTATGMQGISQVFPFAADVPYVLYVRMYIESGQVKVYVLDGNGTTTIAYSISQGLGWVEILIENFTAVNSSYDSNGSIQIRTWDPRGDVGATFYVDAVLIGIDQTNFERFYAMSSGDTLKEKAQTYLNLHKDPKVSYEVDLIDLYEQDPTVWSEDKFGVGDRVKVYDAEMGIDTTLLVVKKTTNLLRPTDCQIEIARAPKRITDILKDFKDKDTDKNVL